MRPSFFRAIHYIFPTLSKKKGRLGMFLNACCFCVSIWGLHHMVLDLSLYDLPLEPAIIFPKESRPVEDDSALSVAQKKRQSELPSSTKKLNRLLGSQHVGKVVLQEGDLQEKFVRGSSWPSHSVIQPVVLMSNLQARETEVKRSTSCPLVLTSFTFPLGFVFRPNRPGRCRPTEKSPGN